MSRTQCTQPLRNVLKLFVLKLFVPGLAVGLLALTACGTGSSDPSTDRQATATSGPEAEEAPQPLESGDWRVLFLSARDGGGTLAVVDPATPETVYREDGAEGPVAALLPGTGAGSPRWVDAWGKVAFLREQESEDDVEGPAAPAEGDEPPVVTELWTLDPASGETLRHFVNPDEETIPAISYDGSKIAYSTTRDGNRDLFVASLETRADGTFAPGEARRVTTDPAPDLQPAWSPDGERLAFVSQRDGNSEVYVLDLANGEVTNVSRSEAYEGHPSWAPDGRAVLFDSNRTGEGTDVFLQLLDGSPARNLTKAPGVDLVARFAPDGSAIAFGSARSDDWEIWVMRPDGSDAQPLTAFPGFDGDANWIPAVRVP